MSTIGSSSAAGRFGSPPFALLERRWDQYYVTNVTDVHTMHLRPQMAQPSRSRRANDKGSVTKCTIDGPSDCIDVGCRRGQSDFVDVMLFEGLHGEC